MREIKRGFLVAVAVCLMGTAERAWACPLVGEVVCPGTSTPAEGVTVTFTAVSGYAFENPQYCSPLTDVTDTSGLFDFGYFNSWEQHLCGGVYTNNLDSRIVTCDNTTASGIDLRNAPFEGEGLNCAPPPQEADCSPGFYKKNQEKWCSGYFEGAANTTTFTCQDGNAYTCAQLVCLLSAEPPCKSNAVQRAFAKGCLDSMFTPAICPGE